MRYKVVKANHWTGPWCTWDHTPALLHSFARTSYGQSRIRAGNNMLRPPLDHVSYLLVSLEDA